MSSKPPNKRRHSLALRLTLWYASLFTASSLVVLAVFLMLIGSVVQQQTDGNLLDEVEEFTKLMQRKGQEAVREELLLEAESEGPEEMFGRLLDPSGRVIATTDVTQWENVGVNLTALKELAAAEQPVFESVELPRRHSKARIVYTRIAPAVILQMGWSLDDDTRLLDAFKNFFAISTLVIMLAATAIGWFLAKRALSGVATVAETADHISRGDLDRRVHLDRPDAEIQRLADAFNAMLDRIHTLVRSMGEMTDNIAHDLKSPIARIRGSAELCLLHDKSTEQMQATAAGIMEECDRLMEMIGTMLLISETEAGAGSVPHEPVALAEIVSRACELFEPLAEEKAITLHCRTAGDSIVRGDRQNLQRLVANLLDNAIKFTPRSGRVSVTLDNRGDRHRLIVHDSGPGISASELSRIFERFYRGDRSRSRQGAGLGLSLCRAIVNAHGGSIAVENAPGGGTRFMVTLPATQPA